MRLLFFSLAFVLSLTTVRGQSPNAPAAKGPNVAFELHCLSLPQPLAAPLIRRLNSDNLAEQAKVMQELDEMLIAGEVTLQGWLIATTHDRQKALAEDIEELRYATEFDMPQAQVHLPDKDADIRPAPDRVEVDAAPMATAFDTRNLGLTLEIEPTLSDDRQSIAVTFMAQHVRLKSVDRVAVEREFTSEKKSQKTVVEQPRFTVLKEQTSLWMKNGEHKLIGIFRGPEGDKSLELFILSARVVESPEK